METFSLSKTVAHYPTLPYKKIKEDILGSKYHLSLVFVGKTRAKRLNKTYRKKAYIPNVLTFPLSKDTGEIYICPEIAKSEAKKAGIPLRAYTGFLFIHGLLHLKGHRHGATMEEAEKQFISKYKLK